MKSKRVLILAAILSVFLLSSCAMTYNGRKLEKEFMIVYVNKILDDHTVVASSISLRPPVIIISEDDIFFMQKEIRGDYYLIGKSGDLPVYVKTSELGAFKKHPERFGHSIMLR